MSSGRISEYFSGAPDDRKGSGYSHLGPARGSGQLWRAGSIYPYREDTSPEEDCDPEIDSWDTIEDNEKFLRAVGLNYRPADPLKVKAGDRDAMVTGKSRLGLETHERTVPPSYYKISPRRKDGDRHGWSRPPLPLPGQDEESVDRVWDILASDERALAKAARRPAEWNDSDDIDSRSGRSSQ